ncbi:MAG: outer membrane protein transport protein [Candidatus Omnitrophica bacterium]|nr:outer membrane protein transport protein [Candidatus Omnitrophota bacterium]
MKIAKRIKDAVKRWFRSTSRGCILVLAIVSFWPSRVAGVGYRLPNQDPEAIARGNAFVATADNPSAIYYNPAGITQLQGQTAQAGLYLIQVGITYDSPSGEQVKNSSDIQPVPQLYYVYSLKDLPLSFGLGVYIPYGLSVEYPDYSPLRTVAVKGSLLYGTVNPVVAWKILPSLSLAIGPTINYSQVEFTRGIGLSPNDLFMYSGDAFDAGFNAGLFWQPYEKWAFGAKYHYSTTMNYDGHSEAYPYAPSTDTTAEIPFPQFVAWGVSFRPTPNWNLEVDLDWTDWDNADQIPFHGTFGGDQVFLLDGTSSFMYEFGVTRQLGKGYFCSTGYIFSQKSEPDRTFNPIIPDSNLHLGGVGFGHRGKRWDWSIGYQFALGDRDVKNDIVNPAANGSYDIFNEALNLAVRFRF